MAEDNDIFERIMEHVRPLKREGRVSALTDPKPNTSKKKESPLIMKEVEKPYDRTLDLHGMHEDEAFYVVEKVFKENAGRKILVITGKSGILRQNFPRWVEMGKLKKYVRLSSIAPAEYGGDGAFLVTLNKLSPLNFGDTNMR